jgi:hypothetical protein
MKRLAPIMFVLPLIFSGCTVPLKHYGAYRGDGAFTSHPAPSTLCQDGYTVDLGPIALDKPDRLHRTLQGLPHVESILGVAVASKTPDAENPRPSALITMTLRDENGHIVLSLQDRLSQWTRLYTSDDPQHAFIYQPGRLIDVAVEPGLVHVQRFPIGEDDSWGTYFTPRSAARYTLDFTVDEPDPAAAEADIRLQVRRALAPCM